MVVLLGIMRLFNPKGVKVTKIFPGRNGKTSIQIILPDKGD